MRSAPCSSRLGFALCLVCLFAGPSAQAQTRISGAQLAQSLEQGLQGLILHLDYDVEGAQRARVERSFVQLPERLGGTRTLFSVPEQVVDLGALGRAVYRVRDVNLDRLNVAAKEGAFVLSLFFESQGFELVAARANSGLEQLAPDVQLDRMRVDVELRPKHGEMAFETASVLFDADVAPAGLDSSVPGASAFLDNLTQYKQRFKELVQRELTRAVANSGLLDALNRRLSDELDGAVGKGAASKLHFEGTDVVFGASAAPAASPKPKTRR